MNASKLKKQLVRDLKASPQKAAVLGLLLLAALYFWSPLVVRWLRPEAKTDVAVAEEQAVLEQPAPAVAPSTAPKPPEHTWQQLVTWMDQDPRMLPAQDAAFLDTAFAAKPVKVEISDEDEPAEVAAVVEASPQSAGLVLSGTLIGSKRRTAMINGRSYTVGSQIEVAPGVRFAVAEISPKRVVLSRGPQRFELAMAKSEGAQAAGLESNSDR